MNIIKNYNSIFDSIKLLSKKTTLIVVTKNQELNKINLLINAKHFDFGENRVQEATFKWKVILQKKLSISSKLILEMSSKKMALHSKG